MLHSSYFFFTRRCGRRCRSSGRRCRMPWSLNRTYCYITTTPCTKLRGLILYSSRLATARPWSSSALFFYFLHYFCILKKRLRGAHRMQLAARYGTPLVFFGSIFYFFILFFCTKKKARRAHLMQLAARYGMPLFLLGHSIISMKKKKRSL